VKGLLALAVIGVFASGLIGTWAFSQVTEQARAAPPLQAREDQITIFSDAGSMDQAAVGTSDFGLLLNAERVRVGIDSLDYPSSAIFRLEAVFSVGTPVGETTTICIRLLDVTSAVAVPGSDACYTQTGTGAGEIVRLRSSNFSLSAGEHDYVVEGKTSNKGAVVGSARIIAEWTERR